MRFTWVGVKAVLGLLCFAFLSSQCIADESTSIDKLLGASWLLNVGSWLDLNFKMLVPIFKARLPRCVPSGAGQ